MVAGKQAAVDGNLSPEQTLRQLLQGSGLDYQIDAGSVMLRPVINGTGEAGALLVLGVTNVEGGRRLACRRRCQWCKNHPGARTCKFAAKPW